MALTELKPIPYSKIKSKLFNPVNMPIFIKGGFRGDALEAWKDLEHLKFKMGNAYVDIETYKHREDFKTSKSNIKNISFDKFVDNMDTNIYLPDCSLIQLKGNHNIHHHIFNDLENPLDEKMGLSEIPTDYYLFMGKNTKSGCHCHIEEDFIVNQIIGSKRFYLMDYKQTKPNFLFHKRNNFSKKNFWELDKTKHNIYYVDLEPGDMLSIPPWWWHSVQSDGLTIAVTKIYEREDTSYLYKKGHESLKRRHWLNTKIPTAITEFIRRIF